MLSFNAACNRPRLKSLARSLLSAVALTACCALQPQASAQTGGGEIAKRQADELLAKIQTLKLLVDLAEQTCLSNHTSTETAGISVSLGKILSSFTAGADVERQVKELRGASEQLTGTIAKLENDDIRKCMNEKLAQAFAFVGAAFLASDPGAVWPEPIEFRFNFSRNSAGDTAQGPENLRVDLRGATRPPITRIVTSQTDPSGAPYYQVDIRYPADRESIDGSIVPVVKSTSSLSTEPTRFTQICLQRPSNFPASRADYDMFDCAEGGVCRSLALGTGWLATCPKPGGEAVPPRGVRPSRYAALLSAYAQSSSVERRWVVPSLATLIAQNSEGVGYTVFTLSTAAFQKSGALGVEIDVRVNGTAVEEDGLPAAVRPVANDPEQRFAHSFALQSLDFQGLRGGCDDIRVSLRPVYADGRKGDPRSVMLSYAALRDVEERTVPFGDSVLTWRAAYITPNREWRYYPIVHSYIYTATNLQEAAASAAAAEADRRWFDEQGFSYMGQRVLGVVRPPRTVQPNGTAAFGLAAGLLQPTGQVHFTFPAADARQFAEFLFQQRERSETASRVIEPDKYVFQAIGGYRTVKGVCGTG